MTIIAQHDQSTNSQTASLSFPNREALDSIWQSVVTQLKHDLGQSVFNAYIRDSWPVELNDRVLMVVSPTEQARDWSNSRLVAIVNRQLAPMVNQPVQVRFIFPAPNLQIDISNVVTTAPVHAETILSPEISSETGDYLKVDEGECQHLILEEAAGSIETALIRPERIIAFPRYELRFIPLVGPENFFLRLAFLQERFLHTREDGRNRPFETSVESLLRWANVGRATLHRFKKGDSGRGQMPAAGWFGIEQLPSAPRSSTSQQQPPCRFRMQTGIPLTPVDADRLRQQLLEAGIRQNPLQALQALCERPINEILSFPAPTPDDTLRGREPTFNTVASVVKSALEGAQSSTAPKSELDALIAKLSDHITMPHQKVHVSWYFLQEWLPVLGHDAAAMVLYTRSQGFYNPQTNELRDEVHIQGGYSELARVIGLKRDRTIGDWLPNLFDTRGRSKDESCAPADDGKWAREQQRMTDVQRNVSQFLQVVPGSRIKTAAGHFAFKLHVEIKGEPLTPADQSLHAWAQELTARCTEEAVIKHFLFWVQSDTFEKLARRAQLSNDGAGILGECDLQNGNDVWGILGASLEYQQRAAETQMTAGESDMLRNDGWGILAGILNDSPGILGAGKLTAGERFKGLLRLNTFWKTIRIEKETTAPRASVEPVVVGSWDLRAILQHNGGINPYRETLLAQPDATRRFLSWLFYACGTKGRGIQDPVGWALTRLKENPAAHAGNAYYQLAKVEPDRIAWLLRRHIEAGMAPTDRDWSAAFNDAQLARLRDLEEILGLTPAVVS